MNSPSLTLLEKKSVASSFSPETVHILALTGVAFAVVVPMILWGMPSALDLSNHFRFALPFYDALRSGHLYPGWLAESNHGFGDASFRFYPPALYYLLSAFSISRVSQLLAASRCWASPAYIFGRVNSLRV
jgi:uncharacterized membrane protein